MSKRQDLFPPFLEKAKEKEATIEREPTETKTKATRREVKRNSMKIGCKEGETRFTTIVREDLLEEVRRLAYWDRRSVKAVFDLALTQYVQAYERKNGKLEPIPKR